MAAVFFGGAFKRFKSLGFRCHRLRHENLHNFEKNLDQNGLLRKKLEHFEIGQPKILRSKNLEIFIEIFIENSVEKKRSQKISKIFDLFFFIFIELSMKNSR